MTAFDRLKKLCKERGISINALEEQIGVGKNVLYSWKTKIPGGAILQKVADYFDVSIDYLLGRTSSRNRLSGKDAIDFEDFMNNEVDMTFFGEDMTQDELQRLKDIMIATFFEKLQERNNKEKNNNV
ncbi:helix-turn-helix domain-containing protein [Carnobacterium maltaromaticum]|uniref:helix-turn-helix domain-containing protein n=1 Tax=Carnobacterium maltaromaticum TaxID=2751 RepID=UPI0039B008EA